MVSVKEQIAKRQFRASDAETKDLTDSICAALQEPRVTVIPDACKYSTDRPINMHHSGFIGPNGNSEVEAGHSFEIGSVISALGSTVDKVRVSMNSIRIYGPVSGAGVMHYHGFSKRNLERIDGAYQAIIFVVHSIGEVENDRLISISEARGTGESLRARTVLVFEQDNELQVADLDIGDMVILPSGVAHTFSALQGTWASYSVMELASHTEVMYQTHWLEEEGEGSKLQSLIKKKAIQEGVECAGESDLLSLADVPSLQRYIR